MALRQISTRNSEATLYRTPNLERFLKEINSEENLTKEEERYLIGLAQEGDVRARNKVIKANLKFAVSCSKEYQKRNFELMDLISAGYDGLIEAVNKFDLEKDIRFISYAVWRIRAKLIVFIRENVSLIQLPLNQQNEIAKIKKLKELLDNKEGYEHTYGEVIEATEELDYKMSYVGPAIDSEQSISSLDQPDINNEDDSRCLSQTVPSSNDNVEIEMFKREKNAIIYNVLGKLTKTQQDVLALSYGLVDGVERTNEDIALRLKKTPESVKQIRNKLIETLSKNKLLQEIR